MLEESTDDLVALFARHVLERIDKPARILRDVGEKIVLTEATREAPERHVDAGDVDRLQQLGEPRYFALFRVVHLLLVLDTRGLGGDRRVLCSSWNMLVIASRACVSPRFGEVSASVGEIGETLALREIGDQAGELRI